MYKSADIHERPSIKHDPHILLTLLRAKRRWVVWEQLKGRAESPSSSIPLVIEDQAFLASEVLSICKD
ncbi:hypothetical protein LENED_008989 [Lentinula edodes]|uniref:Uncharacterized protein n=1 Tax=Lentinula edodes TaxID=5353 RepID=A0A1Q3EII4_LENED|nr:hypothetical protein LENED_008989 [Lentinula edodes]